MDHDDLNRVAHSRRLHVTDRHRIPSDNRQIALSRSNRLTFDQAQVKVALASGLAIHRDCPVCLSAANFRLVTPGPAARSTRFLR